MRTERQKQQQREASARYRAAHPDVERTYYARHRDERLAYQIKWQHENPDKVRATREKGRGTAALRMRRWRAANPDKVKAAEARAVASGASKLKQRRHRVRHREEMNAVSAAAMREFRANHPEEYRAIRKAWEAENREKMITYQVERKRKTTGKLSPGIVALLMEEQGGKCPYCFADLKVVGFALDHYMPLKLKGEHCDSKCLALSARHRPIRASRQ